MALLTRLRCMPALERCTKLYFVSKNAHHILSKTHCAPKKTGTRFFFNFFKKPSQSKLKEADNVPDEFELIYRNTMYRYLLGAQIVSIIGGGVIILAFVLKAGPVNEYRDTVQWSNTAAPTKNEEILYMSSLVVFLVVTQLVIARCPIRIYKVPGTSKYVNVSYGNYFFGKEKYRFNRGQVFRMDETGFLPWNDSRYLIKKDTDQRTIILLDNFFRRPADLSIMLGEQKDPDLET